MATNRIHAKGCRIEEEAVAAGAITPGHLIKLQTAGTVVVQPTAKLKVPIRVAEENALLGKTIADAYASGDRVQQGVYPPGSEFYGWVTTSQTIVKGTMMEAGAGGTFQAFTDGVVLCEAQEAVTTTGAAARILLKVA